MHTILWRWYKPKKTNASFAKKRFKKSSVKAFLCHYSSSMNKVSQIWKETEIHNSMTLDEFQWGQTWANRLLTSDWPRVLPPGNGDKKHEGPGCGQVILSPLYRNSVKQPCSLQALIWIPVIPSKYNSMLNWISRKQAKEMTYEYILWAKASNSDNE